jgi:hypothetical protein
MKTPWSNLLKYGTAFAVALVITIASMLLMAAVAVAIVVAKISVVIK